MKFYQVVLRSIVILCFLASLTAQATETITIDARNTGNRVHKDMFGANFVFRWNNLDQLENTLPHLKQHTVRYPGGSVTENDFNPVDPLVYMDGSAVPDNRDIQRYISMVNQYNWSATFVVPAIRYINDHNRGRDEIEQYGLFSALVR